MAGGGATLPRIGHGVVLRRLDIADLPDFQAYRHDPEVGRYQGWSPTPDEQALAFLAEMAAVQLLAPGEWTQIGIADPQSGRLWGDIGLYVAPEGDWAEIGFTLARPAQGRGLATAAVREAIDLVFAACAVQRVIGITDARNTPSMRLLERVGMQRTQTRNSVFRGEPCVELMYARERDGR